MVNFNSADNTAIVGLSPPQTTGSSALEAIPLPPPGADIANLFAHVGAAADANAYREIHADAQALTASDRWPLLAELLAMAGSGAGT